MTRFKKNLVQINLIVLKRKLKLYLMHFFWLKENLNQKNFKFLFESNFTEPCDQIYSFFKIINNNFNFNDNNFKIF